MEYISKDLFISAYCYLYGSTKKAAFRAWKNTGPEYKKEIIRGYTGDCKKAFYND